MSGYHVSLCPVKAKRGKANRGPARGLIAELPVTRVLGEITPIDTARAVQRGVASVRSVDCPISWWSG